MKLRFGFAFAMEAVLAFIGGYLLAERQMKFALAEQNLTVSSPKLGSYERAK